LMALVGHPRPVNPRPRLAAVAAERGWPVLRVAASSGRMRVRSLIGKGA
jgi:phosphoserine phosphatase